MELFLQLHCLHVLKMKIVDNTIIEHVEFLIRLRPFFTIASANSSAMQTQTCLRNCKYARLICEILPIVPQCFYPQNTLLL